MANFATDGQICIEREIQVTAASTEFGDFTARFDIGGTCKWITENNYLKVTTLYLFSLKLNIQISFFNLIARNISVSLLLFFYFLCKYEFWLCMLYRCVFNFLMIYSVPALKCMKKSKI